LAAATEARERLITENMGLVHACAARFRGKGAEYDDLVQAGCVGLIKAADGFDAGRGFAFSTYAVPVILGEIRRVFRDGGTVKVGRVLKEKGRAAIKERERLTRLNGQEPTLSELAQALRLDVEQTAEILNAALPAVSLTVADEDGERTTDIPVESAEQELAERLSLEQAMAALSAQDRALIELRYSLGLTQCKTAERLGMTQVQVSRREKKILAQLRQNLLV